MPVCVNSGSSCRALSKIVELNTEGEGIGIE